MSKEELEKLKEELREEVRTEVINAMKDNQKTNVWQSFMKTEIRPLLEQKITDKRQMWAVTTALNTIARVYTNRNGVCRINEEDLEKIKPLINSIVNEF